MIFAMSVPEVRGSPTTLVCNYIILYYVIVKEGIRQGNKCFIYLDYYIWYIISAHNLMIHLGYH